MDASHHVTVHARVRYVERCLEMPLARLAQRAGVDADHDGAVWHWAVKHKVIDAAAVEAALVTPATIAACRLNAASVDLGNGCRAMIDGGRVVTILAKDRSRRLLKSHWATRDRHLEGRRSRGFKDRKNKERAHDYA